MRRRPNGATSGSVSRLAALSIAAETRTEPGSRSGRPAALRFSAVQYVTSFDSRVLARPSGCLPARPAVSAGRIGTPEPSMPR